MILHILGKQATVKTTEQVMNKSVMNDEQRDVWIYDQVLNDIKKVNYLTLMVSIGILLEWNSQWKCVLQM